MVMLLLCEPRELPLTQSQDDHLAFGVFHYTDLDVHKGSRHMTKALKSLWEFLRNSQWETSSPQRSGRGPVSSVEEQVFQEDLDHPSCF